MQPACRPSPSSKTLTDQGVIAVLLPQSRPRLRKRRAELARFRQKLLHCPPAAHTPTSRSCLHCPPAALTPTFSSGPWVLAGLRVLFRLRMRAPGRAAASLSTTDARCGWSFGCGCGLRARLRLLFRLRMHAAAGPSATDRAPAGRSGRTMRAPGARGGCRMPRGKRGALCAASGCAWGLGMTIRRRSWLRLRTSSSVARRAIAPTTRFTIVGAEMECHPATAAAHLRGPLPPMVAPHTPPRLRRIVARVAVFAGSEVP